MKKRLFVIAAAVLGAASLVFAVVAAADHGHGKNGQKFLRSSLAPSVPTDPAFHGRTAGGLPWVLDRGSVRIERGGRFDLRVRGLIIPTLGNPDGVTTISASLFCGADANTVAAATTRTFPLSSHGNGRIRQKVDLPATCLAPIVLVHPNGGAARYIALTGWRP